jgi:hypothetical protein
MSAATSRLTRDAAGDFVAAGLALTRLVPPGAEAAVRSGPWILTTMGERLDLPPVGVIADLGALLFGASLDALRVPSASAADDRALAAALRRYEDGVLGRLAADARLTTAGYAVARLPKEMHAQAVGLLVASVLSRVGFDAGVELEPGVVRTLTERTPRDTAQRGFDVLRNDAAVRVRLTEGYSALVRGAQKARDLLGDADLFALENLTVLGSLTQRLAITFVMHAEEAMAAAIPKRLPRKRRKEGSIATSLEDESAYPVGGFSSVSTSGSLENLVTSELIYMNPPGPGGAPKDDAIDLFDMRYVEGELLYYTRDEAIFVRRRRVVVLALEADLVRARVKDPGVPWQRIVLVLALVVVVTKKLVELLGEEALDVRVTFLWDPRGSTPLADEKALAELLLREWIDRGLASVTETSWTAVVETAEEEARRALVEVVHLRTATVPRSALHTSVVHLDFPVGAASLADFSKAAVDLVASLL